VARVTGEREELLLVHGKEAGKERKPKGDIVVL
jgi:hypothetical protein